MNDRLFALAQPYLLLAVAVTLGYALRPLLAGLLGRIVRRTSLDWDDLVLERMRPLLAPATILLLVQALNTSSPEVRDAIPGGAAFLGTLWTILAAWGALRALGLSELLVARHLAGAGADNLRQRSLATQVRVARRILAAAVVFLAFSLCLLNFEEVRKLGTGLLASAGIAGIVIGLSAQKALGNLLAGVQIAFSQPIRLDDVVVVEGEWGRIEEITLTYVVVRIWDRRTLVLPISYFLEKPFQNWTRTSADLIGTVTWEVDHTIDVDFVRAELDRLVRADPLWDGELCLLQVTASSASTITLRALVTTSDSGKGWDLRCNVREGILKFLRQRYPRSLPRSRMEMSRPESLVGLEPAT